LYCAVCSTNTFLLVSMLPRNMFQKSKIETETATWNRYVLKAFLVLHFLLSITLVIFCCCQCYSLLFLMFLVDVICYLYCCRHFVIIFLMSNVLSSFVFVVVLFVFVLFIDVFFVCYCCNLLFFLFHPLCFVVLNTILFLL
jgi:hypothetical protein